MKVDKVVIRIAKELVARKILTREEAEAILRCKETPGEIVRAILNVYKLDGSSINKRGDGSGKEEQRKNKERGH